MPIRKKPEAEIVDVTAVPLPTKFSDMGDSDKLHDLAKRGLHYLSLKRKSDEIGEQISKEKDSIKKDFLESHLYDKNGAHKEIYAPAGDGLNEVFIQIQARESISTVANIVDLVKQKLGTKADAFLMVTEVLHKDALEAMFNQGLITKKDIQDWTVSKATESFIVKLNKKRG